MPKEKLVEIARSFSFKLNVGNYESRDFFCSQKAECEEKNAEAVSEKLYDFCRNEVMKSVATYHFENEPKKVGDKAVSLGKKWQKDLENTRQETEEGQDKNIEEEANQKFAEEVDNLQT